MKKALLNPLFFYVLALFATPVLADFTPEDSAKAKAYCQGGSFRRAAGFVEDQRQANAEAKQQIVSDITSQVGAITHVSSSKKEGSGGVLEVSNSYSTAGLIKSDLILHDFQEIGSPKRLESGLYEYKGYVCNSTAAKPYSDSLDIYLRTKLNAFEQQAVNSAKCTGVEEIYAKMRGWQRILEILNQMNKAQQEEYERIDAKIKKECDEMGKGIFLDENYKSDEKLVGYIKGLAKFQAGSQCGKGGTRVRAELKEIGENGCIIDKKDKNPRYECKFAIKISGEDCYNHTIHVINGVVVGKGNRPNEAKIKAEDNLRDFTADECSPCKNGNLEKELKSTLKKWERGEK